MPDIVSIALIGLFVLFPLVVYFLVILAALKSKRSAKAVPELKKPERYGWEDYLKLTDNRPKTRNKTWFGVTIVTVLIIVLVGTFTFSPLEFPFTDTEMPEPESVIEPINLPELFTKFSETLSKISQYQKHIKIAIAVIAGVALAIALVMHFARRSAVIDKASKTVEKLEKKAQAKTEAKAKKSKKPRFNLFSKFPSLKIPDIKKYRVPAVLIIIIAVAVVLIYKFRNRLQSDLALSLLTQAKDLASVYKLYIIAGIVILVVAILILRRTEKSK